MNNDLIVSIVRLATILIPGPKPPRTDYSQLTGAPAKIVPSTASPYAPSLGTAPAVLEPKPTTTIPPPKKPSQTSVPEPRQQTSMPTTAETITALKQRLGKELYRVELDLQAGARIAGKPCDCLTRAKHLGGLEATAEELLSYEHNPLYGNVLDWVKHHEIEFQPSEIAKHDKQYYRDFTPEVRDFRKEVTAEGGSIEIKASKESKAA